MAGSSFGTLFKLTTFGESHGDSIGGIIEGFPAGFFIDFDFIQLEKQAGYVGFIFRYKDDKDFYIIDFQKNNARLR